MDNQDYQIIVTTPSHPDGVRYPGTGQPRYTKLEAVQYLRNMARNGMPSDYKSQYGAHAESSSERFTLADIDALPMDSSKATWKYNGVYGTINWPCGKEVFMQGDDAYDFDKEYDAQTDPKMQAELCYQYEEVAQ